MPPRKNIQNVPKKLVYVQIAILLIAVTKISSGFNWWATFHKHLKTLFFDKCLGKR